MAEIISVYQRADGQTTARVMSPGSLLRRVFRYFSRDLVCRRCVCERSATAAVLHQSLVRTSGRGSPLHQLDRSRGDGERTRLSCAPRVSLSWSSTLHRTEPLTDRRRDPAWGGRYPSARRLFTELDKNTQTSEGSVSEETLR
ncbi:Golgin candidate 2 [Clarias magur]|uniref:Golgin candidate 2 n=1 Tax=Clarias magur TaxID=1594786 RepID=A0A8J4X2Q8_CLAMG|nr:Golgin candidate 2 [Clarias magur]